MHLYIEDVFKEQKKEVNSENNKKTIIDVNNSNNGYITYNKYSTC